MKTNQHIEVVQLHASRWDVFSCGVRSGRRVLLDHFASEWQARDYCKALEENK